MGTASNKVAVALKSEPVWHGVDAEGHRYRYATDERVDDCPKCLAGKCWQKVIEMGPGCNLIVHDSQDLN